jgi:transposase
MAAARSAAPAGRPGGIAARRAQSHTTEDEIAAEKAAKTATVSSYEHRRPARGPFPDYLPCERIVLEAPTTCSCCGSDRIVKMGEDIPEALEVIPGKWKVIQTVREKVTCQSCDRISQLPAPVNLTPRGWAGLNLLAMILFEKFGQHQPLNRQAERYAKEGVDLSLSTLADQVGACATALAPIHALIRNHVVAAKRLQGDNSTFPLLAKGGTQTARLWTFVRDNRPFAGQAPPAALFHFSRDRGMAHPNRNLAGWKGVLQADPYGDYNDLYRGDRDPGPVLSALFGNPTRRQFFELANFKGNAHRTKPGHDISPVALEAVKKIDTIFDIERRINALDIASRLDARHRLVRPLVEQPQDWMRAKQAAMSKHNPVASAIVHMFRKDRRDAFMVFLEHGRVCLKTTRPSAHRAASWHDGPHERPTHEGCIHTFERPKSYALKSRNHVALSRYELPAQTLVVLGLGYG